MKEDKRQVAIYKIKTEDNLTSLTSIEERIREKDGYFFESLKINQDKFKCYTVRAYIIKKTFSVNWIPFINPILAKPLSFSEESNKSALLLLENKTNHNIYAVSFGILGYFVIQKYIVEDFGINILSHLVSPSTIQCKSTKAQSLVGTKQGETSVYRDFHILEDMIDDFGKIFQELITAISRDKLEHFGINQKDKNGRTKFCIAKDSFKINSSVKAEDIEKLLNGCEWAITQPQYSINSVKILNKKDNQQLIVALDNKCAENLLKTFHKDPGCWNFDLCHKNYDSYLVADKSKLTGKYSGEYDKGPLIKIQDLFDLIKRAKQNVDFKQDELLKFIEKTEIITYNDAEKTLTKDSIKKHLFDEEDLDGKKYFLLNGNWYKLDKSFLDDLNNRLKDLLNIYYLTDNNFLLHWNNAENEEQYINFHNTKENKIIIHPNTVKHIELCDMMHWTDDTLYLYFIKQYFGNEIRSLSSQVFVSANIILRDSKNGFEYLKEVHKKLSEQNLTCLSEQEFLDLFSKKIIVVFAFKDKGSESRDLKTNPEKFGSNIAKYSTLKLIAEMKNIDMISLKIYQIPN